MPCQNLASPLNIAHLAKSWVSNLSIYHTLQRVKGFSIQYGTPYQKLKSSVLETLPLSIAHPSKN
uniref:Uncharacterized protein n=1 Tax=Arion vulgaris TaxID=1028688 RepID=A0A0B6XX03_9EUPU